MIDAVYRFLLPIWPLSQIIGQVLWITVLLVAAIYLLRRMRE